MRIVARATLHMRKHVTQVSKRMVTVSSICE